MMIAIAKEKRNEEKRIAIIPEHAKELIKLGHTVTLEPGVKEISYEDWDTQINTHTEALRNADIICQIHASDLNPEDCKNNALLIGLFDPFWNKEKVAALAKKGVSCLALDFMPRISRAQNMDVLSSMSSIAGYKAVIEAAKVLPKYFPMMSSAAGTVLPAKVLVLGAGVAGLQAIATAKRLGAQVFAYDLRPEVKEQVESLGARFIELKSTQKLSEESRKSEGGYAKELSESEKKEQQEELASIIVQHDVVITTALIPGKPAPLLIAKDVLSRMQKGSVIVDIATEKGGNVEGSEKDAIITKNGVTIIGYSNYPAMMPKDASRLYSKNMLNLILYLLNTNNNETLNTQDEIIKSILLTHQGNIVHQKLL